MSILTKQILALTGTASGAIAAYRAVGFDDAQAGAGDRVKGINRVTAADGDNTTIDRDGVYPWESGAAIAAEDRLVPDSDGRAVPIKETPTDITGISQANPGVVTAAGHGLHTGERVLIHSVGGMVEVNGREFTVTVVDANSFSLDGEDTTGHTAYTSGGQVRRTGPDNVFAEALEAAATAGELPSVIRK